MSRTLIVKNDRMEAWLEDVHSTDAVCSYGRYCDYDHPVGRLNIERFDGLTPRSDTLCANHLRNKLRFLAGIAKRNSRRNHESDSRKHLT